MINNLLNIYYLKKKAYHLLTIKLNVMENNQNKNRQENETGKEDQYDHHQKTDNRQRDTLDEHQNSNRTANPQTQNSNKNSDANAIDSKMNFTKGNEKD